jgi:heme/copper-type cytochrome/quinol oxidase subunit 2
MSVVRLVFFASALALMPFSPFAIPHAGEARPHTGHLEASTVMFRGAVRRAIASLRDAVAPDSIRTVDVVLSRYAFSPDRIEMRLGEPVRLNVVSTDSVHGFQVKALGLKVRVPGRAAAVTIDLAPGKAGTYRITCSEYCGSGHSRMQAWLIVTPAT